MSFSPQAIVALDVGSLREARALVEQLGDGAGFYKVGLQLFSAEGPRVVDWLQASGKRVFLDLKLHDIPRTVARATENARRLGAALVTVHGLGGGAAARAAVDAAGDETGILLVTVLTSFDAASASSALGRPLADVEEEVLRLSALASEVAAHGVVCGGAECAAVLARFGGLRVLVPGIRPPHAKPDDQARAASAAEAAQAGAAYVVLGRIVTAAREPADAYRRALADLAS